MNTIPDGGQYIGLRRGLAASSTASPVKGWRWATRILALIALATGGAGVIAYLVMGSKSPYWALAFAGLFTTTMVCRRKTRSLLDRSPLA